MLVGLVGFIGSGKGSVGEMFAHYSGFTQDSFAAPLKDAVAAIFGWDRSNLEGATPASRLWREIADEFWSLKFGKPFSPRMALQLMGTEAGRNVFHQDLWVVSLINRANQRTGSTIVTDVRFKNEIAAIQKADGIIIRVRRGPDPEWFLVAEDANNGDPRAIDYMKQLGIHQSEWDWIGSPINHTIYNDSTLEVLQDNVRHIATQQDLFVESTPSRMSSDQAIRM